MTWMDVSCNLDQNLVRNRSATHLQDWIRKKVILTPTGQVLRFWTSSPPHDDDFHSVRLTASSFSSTDAPCEHRPSTNLSTEEVTKPWLPALTKRIEWKRRSRKSFFVPPAGGESNVPQKKKTDEILDKNCEIYQQSDS